VLAFFPLISALGSEGIELDATLVAKQLIEACANKSPCWSAECAFNVRQTSVCRGQIGKPLERNWRVFLPNRDKLKVCRTFGIA
jgi:hypothetical protein